MEDNEAEKGALGCILIDSHASLKECARRNVETSWFTHLWHRSIFDAACHLHVAKKPADEITVTARIREQKDIADADLHYVAELTQATPSAVHLNYFLDILQEKRELRWQRSRAREILEKIEAGGAPEELRALLTESASRIQKGVAASSTPRLVVRRCSERRKYKVPPEVYLVGQEEIRLGTEGLTVIAGPGGAGKSMLIATLALAGAIGSGTWMGRKVHRQFRTLIIQAEVGPGRLKNQVDQFAKNHPFVDLDGWIYFTDPPEGGMSIGDAEFWASVRRTVDEVKPDLVVFDPWSHMGVQDEANEVMEALRQIRASVGVGERAPGIVLVCHTKKPRDEKAARGRNLAYIVHGSVALVNTARCAYILLPWSEEDLEDQRVYFACPKLNDGENFAPTVWKRRFGTFFEHDDTDPSEWGATEKKERSSVTRDQLASILDGGTMQRADLVSALVENCGLSQPTAYRITDETNKQAYPFTKGWLKTTPLGTIAMGKGRTP